MGSNSLVQYLENEIEKLREEIENKKNRHYVNQNIIEECQERIKEYQSKDDSIFSLLSPISVESTYKLKIKEEEKIIEDTNEENLILISEIDECNEKIQEIENQLKDTKHYNSSNDGVFNDHNESDNHQDPEQLAHYTEFFNTIINQLTIAEDYCYSNPKACKDILAGLRKYLFDLFYKE